MEVALSAIMIVNDSAEKLHQDYKQFDRDIPFKMNINKPNLIMVYLGLQREQLKCY